MININKRNKLFQKLLRDYRVCTKIELYFSSRSCGDDYDPYEKSYTFSNLAPLTIKGYITDIRPESLAWKQYGLSEVGAKEVITENKYASWFRKCNKVKIDSDEYQVYKESQGNRVLITELPFKLVKIVLHKMR